MINFVAQKTPMKKLIILLVAFILTICDGNSQNLHFDDCTIVNDIVCVGNKEYTGLLYGSTSNFYIDVRNGHIVSAVAKYPNGNIAFKRVFHSKEKSTDYYYSKEGNLLMEEPSHKGWSKGRRIFRNNGTEIVSGSKEYYDNLEIILKYLRDNVESIHDKLLSEMRSGIMIITN